MNYDKAQFFKMSFRKRKIIAFCEFSFEYFNYHDSFIKNVLFLCFCFQLFELAIYISLLFPKHRFSRYDYQTVLKGSCSLVYYYSRAALQQIMRGNTFCLHTILFYSISCAKALPPTIHITLLRLKLVALKM